MKVLHLPGRLALLWSGCLLVVLVGAARGARGAEMVWHPEVGLVELGAAPARTPEAFYAHALGLMVRGDYRAADELLLRGLEQFPASPLTAKMQFRRAECAFKLGREKEAFELCSRLLSAAPATMPGAAPAASTIRKLRYESAISLARRSADAGVALLRHIAEEGNADPYAAAALVEAGTIEMRHCRYGEALGLLDAGRKRQPEDKLAAEATLAMALCHVRLAREQGKTESLNIAAAELQDLLAWGGEPDLLERARNYQWAVQNALAAGDGKVREVFYAVTWYLDGDYGRAQAICRKASRRLPKGTAAEVALFYSARSLEAMGRLVAAYEAFEGLLAAYPATPYFRAVLEAEWRIAERLREAGDRNVLDVLTAIVAHEPRSQRAADATMMRGDWHFDRGDYLAAGEAYRAILEEYGRSPHVPVARFRCGAALYHLAARRDQPGEILEEAAAHLSAYLAEYPHGKFVPEAQRLLAATRNRQAEEFWQIAAFYGRRAEPAARAFYLRLIAGAYADTEWGGRAQAALAAIGASSVPAGRDSADPSVSREVPNVP